MQAKFTGQLYQFRTKRPLHNGAYVAVNGPWDTFGVVMSCRDMPAPGPGELTPLAQCKEKPYLNVVRGVKARAGEKPVAQF